MISLGNFIDLNNATYGYNRIIVAKKIIHEAMRQANTPRELEGALRVLISNIEAKKYGRVRERENINERHRQVSPRSWSSPTVTTIGGVHMTPNTILDIYTARQGAVWELGKKPLTEEFHFGIEVELTTNDNRSEIIRHALNLNLKQYMQIKRDGSIRPTHDSREGFELCLCIPESKLVEVMNNFKALLDAIQAKVNNTCGLHIHLDMRQAGDDRAKQWEAYLNLKMGQNVIKRSVSKSRHASKWCRWVTAADINSARNASSRYRAINGNALRSHGTIEVRAFQATTNCEDIVRYCLMLKKILNTKNPLKRASNSQATLQRIYGYDVVSTMRLLEMKYNAAS